MWVFEWLADLIENNPMMVFVLCVSVLLYFGTALIGFCCRDRGLYAGIAAMITCGVFVVFAAAEKPIEILLVVAVGFSFIGAGFYVLMTCGLIWRAHILRRRKRRAEILRKVQYTLPEKDNTYIRERLNTALHTDVPAAKTENATQEIGNKENFQTSYARKLLEKLQEAPLTKAERLEMQEVSRLFSAYLRKSRWTVEDVRLINDMFSYLLKISAKYAI
jgi:predicted nucleic acid-binding Zn ribbon protein